MKSKYKISVLLSISALLLFVISLQPYAALFVFLLLSVKIVLLIKRQ